MDNALYKYLLMLGDNSLILGHRLSELCGHGPSLETDIALTNISLDLFGQVRSIYQYAASIIGHDETEDSIAFLRKERDYFNCILVEKENIDFAHVIMRQFLFDVFQKLQLEKLSESKDETIAAIAVKSLKESKYHLRFSSEWVKRLGAGTDVSQAKTQEALNELYPFIHEFFVESEVDIQMKENGIGFDLESIKESYYSQINEIFQLAELTIPDGQNRYAQGKKGIHTEAMGGLLAELQFMQRAYPNMKW